MAEYLAAQIPPLAPLTRKKTETPLRYFPKKIKDKAGRVMCAQRAKHGIVQKKH